MSGQVNDYELIKLVQTFPILYDKDLARGQKNATMKDKAWKELSVRLHASERACITRWKSIRDRFGKEYRRVQENPDEPTYWDMFQHLLFLKDHYKHGHAKQDNLMDIKYAHKERRRKVRIRRCDGSQAEDDSNNEDDFDADDLMLNQQLIGLVKDHPVLYDKQKIRDSKNLTAKNDAWSEISQSLDVSEELCYKRWKKLRDRFAREYRYQQLDPQKPVTWNCFQDLMFLEGHYRKGIPLNIETLKRKPPLNTVENPNPWGDDYVFEEQIITESPEEFADIQNSLEELLVLPPAKKLTVPKIETIEHKREELEPMRPSDEPEQKLNNVISNIENALRQSHDCLKSLQQQKQRHQQELESSGSNGLSSQPPMLQKVQVLLDGLSAEHRNRSERKILQFLCECQIKSLNNEEIDDVVTYKFEEWQ